MNLLDVLGCKVTLKATGEFIGRVAGVEGTVEDDVYEVAMFGTDLDKEFEYFVGEDVIIDDSWD